MPPLFHVLQCLDAYNLIVPKLWVGLWYSWAFLDSLVESFRLLRSLFFVWTILTRGINSENPLVVTSSQVGSWPSDWHWVTYRCNRRAYCLHPAVLGSHGGFMYPCMLRIWNSATRSIWNPLLTEFLQIRVDWLACDKQYKHCFLCESLFQIICSTEDENLAVWISFTSLIM